MTELFYVKGADGKYYQQVPVENSDGEFEYVAADPSLRTFQDVGGGRFVLIRDAAELQRQKDGESHLLYFENLKKQTGDDPKKVRQVFKKQEALQRQFEQLGRDMVSPGAHPDVKTVKDSEFLGMQEEYMAAFKEGRGKECRFQPVSTYANKLITRTGKVVRPLLKGEVGMVGSTIYVLEEGFSKENRMYVPENIGEKAGE